MGKGRRNRKSSLGRRVPTPPPPGGWFDGSPYDQPGVGYTTDSFINTDKNIGHRTEFKRIISEYDPKTRKWSNEEKEKDESDDSEDEADPVLSELDQYCFVFRRQIRPQGKDLPPSIHEFIEIKSYYLRKACLDVIGNRSGISWNGTYLQVQKEQVLHYLPEFKEYVVKTREAKERGESPLSQEATEEDVDTLLCHVNLFLDFLQSEYKTLLAEIEDFRRTREIDYEHLWSLFKPNKLYVTNSSFTGDPIVVRLLSTWTHSPLSCEGLESTDDGTLMWKGQSVSVSTSFFGRVSTSCLTIYPLEDHPNLEELKDKLISRGKKWKDLNGVHLKQYESTAFLPGQKAISVHDRVMIDKKAYNNSIGMASTTTTWATPAPAWGAPPGSNLYPTDRGPMPLPPDPAEPWFPTSFDFSDKVEEDLLLAPAHVHGFSFKDKRWFVLQVDHLKPVRWDPLAFEQLSMDMERKALLQSLVEYHDKGDSFQDIVARKGRGLVLNLFGPPGTGKTLTAEALSEYVRKPLYSLTAGDLGSYASALSENLTKVFSLCARWNAIVLLDEADIFLEARSTHEIERNAMVSVFLKELEYFEGVIFLTTNRIEAFDRAFQSRIHVSLRYETLSFRSRREVWVSLLQRSGFNKDKCPLSEKELDTLATAPKNGREIRNIVRTAEAVAVSRGETLGFRHLMQVKDISNEFEVAQAASASQNHNGVVQTRRLSLLDRLMDDKNPGIFILIITALIFAFLSLCVIAGAYTNVYGNSNSTL